MEELLWVVDFIKSIGFPIFVVIWLLYRSDKREEQTAKAIENATIVMIELKEIIKRGK